MDQRDLQSYKIGGAELGWYKVLGIQTQVRPIEKILNIIILTATYYINTCYVFCKYIVDIYVKYV